MSGRRVHQKRKPAVGYCCGGVPESTGSVRMHHTTPAGDGTGAKPGPPASPLSGSSSGPGHAATRPSRANAQRAGSRGQPPGSNTGGKLTPPPSGRVVTQIETSVGWFAGTFPAALRDEVEQVVIDYTGGPFKRRDRGANFYAESSANEAGALVAWSEGRAESWVCLNAGVLGLVLPEDLPELLGRLDDLGVKPTRIDLTVDVPSSMLTVGQVYEDRAHVVGFRRCDRRAPERDVQTGELEGETVYFGRRGKDGSGKFVRFYDKGLESRGQLQATRFEVEGSGEVAKTWGEILCAAQANRFWSKVAKLAVGAIDFADQATAHSHRDRFKRLAWWERVVQLAGSARVVIERHKPQLQRSMEWAHRQLSVLFARIGLTVERQHGLLALDAVRDFAAETFKRGILSDRASPSSLPLDISTVFGFRHYTSPSP